MTIDEKYLAPRPWRVDRSSAGREWSDSCAIIDANGGEVCILTRGYQSEVINGDVEGCPSWANADLIVAAVNAFVNGEPALSTD